MTNYPAGVDINHPHFSDNPPCKCSHEYDDHIVFIRFNEEEDEGIDSSIRCTVEGCYCMDYQEYDEQEAWEDARIARAER
jgi:hypothetical protein